MSSEPEPAFEATLGCENCGDKWADEHPARTKVTARESRVFIMNKDCDRLLSQCEDCCRTARCPTCELTDTVYIHGSRPLGGDDDAE